MSVKGDRRQGARTSRDPSCLAGPLCAGLPSAACRRTPWASGDTPACQPGADGSRPPASRVTQVQRQAVPAGGREEAWVPESLHPTPCSHSLHFSEVAKAP